MAESDRRGRRAARPGAEALEGRMLLSRSARVAPPTILGAQFERSEVSPQVGEVDLTVTRHPFGAEGALEFKLTTSASEGPVYVGAGRRAISRPIRMTGRDPSALPIVPIDGTYRFEPGQASLTIPVRLNPSYASKGEVFLNVATSQPGRRARSSWSPGSSLRIKASPDQVRPEIVSSSHSPQAITLTFSKPMDPATVEDINNYHVTGYALAPAVAPTPLADPPPGLRRAGRASPPPDMMVTTSTRVTLESASYDPATLTVTLTPTEPLTLTHYEVFPHSNSTTSALGPGVQPPTPAVRPLADLQGNLLNGVMFRVGT